MTSSEKSHPIRSWIIEHVLENPKKAIALPVLFTLSMGLGINYLVIDDDMMAMLPETLDSRMSWDAVQDEFVEVPRLFLLPLGIKEERSIVRNHSPYFGISQKHWKM